MEFLPAQLALPGLERAASSVPDIVFREASFTGFAGGPGDPSRVGGKRERRDSCEWDSSAGLVRSGSGTFRFLESFLRGLV